MTRSEQSIIKGMRREHDRLIEMGQEVEAELAKVQDERDATVERGVGVYREAARRLRLRDPNFIVTRLEMWAESYLVQRNKELRTCVEQAQAEVERLREEIKTLRTAVNLRGHVAEFREDGWTLEHPLECRESSLLDCPLNALCKALGGPPEEGPGRYKVALDDSGNLLLAALRGEERKE